MKNNNKIKLIKNYYHINIRYKMIVCDEEFGFKFRIEGYQTFQMI